MDYLDFLESKIDIAPETGISIDPGKVNPALKPHQRDGVLWAVKGGRRALFEAFGLGKTVQELEFCRLILEHKGGRALIVMPLEVRGEFIRDAVNLLGMEPPRYIRHMAEALESGNYLTNYERVRDGDIDPKQFTAASLDEASVLRSYGSKTYQSFLEKFKGVPFKLVATATPAPNKYKELIHYAGYLEVMDTGQALIVLDPFGGLMTVPEVAVKMGRYGVGVELNPGYFQDGAGYLESAEAQIEQPTLFDFMEGAI